MRECARERVPRRAGDWKEPQLDPKSKLGKAVLRGCCEQLGALASQLGLSLEETKGND